MRGQLRHGARKMLDQLDADIDDALGPLRRAQGKTKSNPVFVEQLLDEALTALACLKRRLHDELEPMLERHEQAGATADMAQRLTAAERAISDLKKQVAGLQGVVSKDRAAG